MNINKRFPRYKAVISFFLVALFLILIKLFLIQVLRSDYLTKLADRQHNLFIELEPNRGIIYDRNMRFLSTNIPVLSLFAVPKEIEDKQLAVKKLSQVLGISQDYLKDRLSRNKAFIWISRKLNEQDTQKVKDLNMKGLNFLKEHKRFYPNGYLASHIIGFAGIDNFGLEALELAYDKYLKGIPGWLLVLRDARQRQISLEQGFVPPQDGYDIVLTIDETIQFIAERELDKAFKKYKAQGAMIIVMDPNTGEILAWANRPTYDLNNYSQFPTDNRRNRCVADYFEPGSVFKIITASAAIEENKFKEEDKIFCENGEYRVSNHLLHDHRPHGWLTFREVIQQSSNIGTTKVAQALGPETIYEYVKLFGFGSLTNIDVPGEVTGSIKPPSAWSGTSIGAVPIGQEVGVTALQLVCAISCIANHGVYMKPFIVKRIQDIKGELIKEFKPQAVRRVISQETSERLNEILTGVIEVGTGKLAQIKGVKVAGKTGTAQKIVGGRYSHEKFIASFIGYAPSDDPKLAVAVIVDDPKGSYFGGVVSAPVFKNVVFDTLKYLETSNEINHKSDKLSSR